MSNILVYSEVSFNDQLNAYMMDSAKIVYCAKCDKPNLCLTCKTSIGEATLMRFMSKYYNNVVSPKYTMKSSKTFKY